MRPAVSYWDISISSIVEFTLWTHYQRHPTVPEKEVVLNAELRALRRMSTSLNEEPQTSWVTLANGIVILEISRPGQATPTSSYCCTLPQCCSKTGSQP